MLILIVVLLVLIGGFVFYAHHRHLSALAEIKSLVGSIRGNGSTQVNNTQNKS